MLPTPILLRFLAATAFWATGLSMAGAQTWNGASSNNWSDAGNWTGGVPINDGTANVVFPKSSSQAYLLDGDWSINTLTFSGTCIWDVQLSGNLSPTLTLHNGISDTIASSLYPDQPVVISNITINLAQPQTWDIETSASITALITGPGGFSKTGGGTLVLAPGNTYQGSTAINGGTVKPVDETSFGSATSGLTLDGGTVDYQTASYTDATNLTVSRPITLGNGGGTVVSKRVLTLASAISGPGALTIARDSTTPYIALTPTVTLSGQNTFAGGLSITDPLYASLSPTDTFLVTAAGTNQCLGNGPVSLAPGTSLSVNAESNFGPGQKVTLVANSALILAADSISPSHIIAAASTAGSVELSGPTFNTAINLATLGDGSLSLGVADSQTVTYAAPSLTAGAGNVYRLGGNRNNTVTQLVIGGHDNVLTGNASLLVNGPLNILNVNNFTGGTTVVAGSLGVGAAGALGSGTVVLGGTIFGVNGNTVVTNAIQPQNYGRFQGPLTLTGPIDLQGGTPALFVVGTPRTVTFANVVGNGTLSINSGLVILQAANTFFELDLWEGGASVASESNLAGNNTPINFDGFNNQSSLSATLETTASFTLNNPIRFNRSNAAFATFQVDAGTTLTLTETITGGTIIKTGSGTLAFSSTSSLSGGLNIYAGNVTSAGSRLSQSLVETFPGGTFSGSGTVNWLVLTGGTVAPGNGSGTIACGSFSATAVDGATTLQFLFNQRGSPTYANLDASGNGLISLNFPSSASSLNGNNISIFLAAANLQTGDSFKGAFLVQDASVISTFLNGVHFTYYVPSATGRVNFNGRTWSPIDSSAVQQTWVAENGGEVCQFQITGSIAPVVPTISFASWAAQAGYFSAAQQADPAISAASATPQHDGVPNLLKYLFGINPAQTMTSADRAALPVFAVSPTGANAGDLTMTYRQNTALTGVTKTVETTSDLVNWTAASLSASPAPGCYTLNPTGTLDPNTGDAYMQIDFKPVTTGQTLFIRMGVSE